MVVERVASESGETRTVCCCCCCWLLVWVWVGNPNLVEMMRLSASLDESERFGEEMILVARSAAKDLKNDMEMGRDCGDLPCAICWVDQYNACKSGPNCASSSEDLVMIRLAKSSVVLVMVCPRGRVSEAGRVL